MKQVLHSYKDGTARLVEVPAPQPRPGHLIIETRTSLISSGTERSVMEAGRGSLLTKARQNPDKVRKVLDKLKTDGIGATFETVQGTLNTPVVMGYCNAGVVVALGSESESPGFRLGDRVVSNGPHAQVVCVARNLCARIPEGVSFEQAPFAVLGSIALQGIRLLEPTLGENVAVFGLGLVGLLAVQLLQANGCRVLGIDHQADRLALAQSFGAQVLNLSEESDPVPAATAFSGGLGVDGVLLTLSSRSDEPIHQAAQMCRKRGRIVLVGVTGLNLLRSDFYDKELEFRVSCSYGPGRYDPSYEERGQDYPPAFVRWTEQRNFEAVLQMLDSGRLLVDPMISHRFPIGEATLAYKLLEQERGSLGILLEYPAPESAGAASQSAVPLSPPKKSTASNNPALGFVGAGLYASRVLIPAFKKTAAELKCLASQGGVSAWNRGKQFGFQQAASDPEEIFQDDSIEAVVIATRHESHGELVLRALRSRKHVFVEKPLCTTPEQLEEIRREYDRSQSGTRCLMVGFNRRFAPHLLQVRQHLQELRLPKAMVITVNAGALPADHWTQDPARGGGRVIGEACHFIDLLRHLAGCPIVDFTAASLPPPAGVAVSDNFTVTLRFKDGSVGTIHYFANGHRSVPKERLEIYCGGRIACLENFRRLRVYGWPGFRSSRLWAQDKGQEASAAAFVEALRSGGPDPIPIDEIWEVCRLTLEVHARIIGSK